jgi:hypothetical protein
MDGSYSPVLPCGILDIDLTPAAAGADADADATTPPPSCRRAARSAHGNGRGRCWAAGSGAPRRNRPPCASDTSRRCCSAPTCAAPAALTVVRQPWGLPGPGAGAVRSLRARACAADIARLCGKGERMPPPRRLYLSAILRAAATDNAWIPRSPEVSETNVKNLWVHQLVACGKLGVVCFLACHGLNQW